MLKINKVLMVILIVAIVVGVGVENGFSAYVNNPMTEDLNGGAYKIFNVTSVAATSAVTTDIITKRPWVDVRAFGAVGDGVTDSTAAIQAAVDSLPFTGADGAYSNPGTGGVVYIPAGHYKLTSNILINKDYVCIEGSGPYSSVLDIQANMAAIAFQPKGGGLNYRHIAIENLGIVSNTTNFPNSTGIAIDDVWALIIRNVRIYRCGSGIYSTGGTVASDNVWIDTVYVEACKNYQYLFNKIGQIYLVNCYSISWKDDAGPDGYTIIEASSVRMVNCVADGNRYGYVFSGTALKPVTDCHLVSCRTYGSRRGINFLGYIQDCSFTGNVIGGNIDYQGLFIEPWGSESIQRVEILGNEIYGTSSAGIYLNGTGTLQDIFITGNNLGGAPTPFTDNHTGAKNRVVINNNINIDAVVTRHLMATAVWDPPSLSNGSVASTTVTVTGAAVDDIAYASHNQIGAKNVQISAHVQAANTVRVVLRNVTGGALDIASGTLRVNVWKY